jgi:hypothetical protein
MTAPPLASVDPSIRDGVVSQTTVDRSWLALVLLGALALAVGVAVIDNLAVGVMKDDGMYVILARSLATGEGYRYLNLPGAPAGTHFPPGYPALLALVSLVSPSFPANAVVFKLLNAVLLAAAAVLVARLVGQRTGSERLALGVGAASAVSVPLLVLSSMVMSEPLFLAIVLALLAALERFAEGPGNVRGALLLAVGIGACMLVRSHGIALIPAALLVLGARRRWRDAGIVAGVALLCLVPWQWWSARHAAELPAPMLGAYGPYTSWWVRGLAEMGPSMIPRTLERTVPEVASMLAVLFSPWRGDAARVATLLAFGALAAAGVAAYWRRLPVTLLFLGGYLAIVLVWPFAPTRFVWCVWPLVLLLPALGLQAAVGRAAWPRAARAGLVLAFAWLAAGYAAYELRAVRGAWWSSIARANTRALDPLARWILANTSPDQIIATDDEEAVFLYTGRRTVSIISFTTRHYLAEHEPVQDAREGLAPILDAYPVSLVVVRSTQSYATAAALTGGPTPRLKLREHFAGGAAFTVLPK